MEGHKQELLPVPLPRGEHAFAAAGRAGQLALLRLRAGWGYRRVLRRAVRRWADLGGAAIAAEVSAGSAAMRNAEF